MIFKKLTICLGVLAMTLQVSAQNKIYRFNTEAYKAEAPQMQTEPNGFEHPAGTLEVYNMSFGDQFYYMGGSYSQMSGAASNVVLQGDNTVWFYNLAPTSCFGWAKGERNGNEISVAMQKIGELSLTGDAADTEEVWIRPVTTDNSGYLKLLADPYKLLMKDDSICSADTSVWLATFLVKDNKGILFCLDRKYAMAKEQNTKLYSAQEGAPLENYIFQYTDEWLNTKYSAVTLSRSGNDVYMRGLVPSSPNVWIKGELDESGKKLSITPGIQFLGSETGFLLDYVGGVLLDDGYSVTPCDALTFNVGENLDNMEVMQGGHIMVFNRATEELKYLYADITGKRYLKDVPAVPAAVNKISVESGYGDKITFRLPTCDTEGNYINPKKITWRMYLDDQLYTFDKEEYTDLDASLTELPYSYTTKYDFNYNQDFNYQQFYIYDRTWAHLDIQAIYTVDGVRHESALSRYSLKKGYQGTTAISHATAENAIRSEQYGIDGMRRSSLSRGINIVRTTQQDGTVSIKKILK